MELAEKSKKMKQEIASARKKAVFARSVYNRSFVSPDDALPALVSSFRMLKRAVEATGDGDGELREIDEASTSQLSLILGFHEKYQAGLPTDFSRKHLDKSIEAVHRLTARLTKYRLSRLADRRERLVARSLHAIVIGGFVLLFGVTAVGLVLGFSHPDYDEGLYAEYYRKSNFKGQYFKTLDHQIDFQWGEDSPMKGMPRDKFSIRWEGCVRVESSDGMFITAAADDDIRVIINAETVIDTWDAEGYKDATAEKKLGPGVHPIELQYRERGDDAYVFLGWTPDGSNPVAIPPENLLPKRLNIGGRGINPDCPPMPKKKKKQ